MQLDAVSLRVDRFSGAAFIAGREAHRLERVPVQVYSPAKTTADSFEYRNNIGLDVPLEDCTLVLGSTLPPCPRSTTARTSVPSEGRFVCALKRYDTDRTPHSAESIRARLLALAKSQPVHRLPASTIDHPSVLTAPFRISSSRSTRILASTCSRGPASARTNILTSAEHDRTLSSTIALRHRLCGPQLPRGLVPTLKALLY